MKNVSWVTLKPQKATVPSYFGSWEYMNFFFLNFSSFWLEVETTKFILPIKFEKIDLNASWLLLFVFHDIRLFFHVYIFSSPLEGSYILFELFSTSSYVINNFWFLSVVIHGFWVILAFILYFVNLSLKILKLFQTRYIDKKQKHCRWKDRNPTKMQKNFETS